MILVSTLLSAIAFGALVARTPGDGVRQAVGSASVGAIGSLAGYYVGNREASIDRERAIDAERRFTGALARAEALEARLRTMAEITVEDADEAEKD